MGNLAEHLTMLLSLVWIAAAIPAARADESYFSPPYYPTPHGGWASDWEASYTKAVALVYKMTLAEKVNITAGTGQYMGIRCVGTTGSVDRLGFPQICLQDGPLGVRMTTNVTAFPAGITTGATFDKSLIYSRGVAIGQEFRGKGAHVYLGPSVGPLGRKPRGGRNWEGFGSDPVLEAIAGAETIRGVQEQGVTATIKHLIGNEQEMYRAAFWQNPYTANIDDRTMHEVYLWPFAEAVRAGVGAAMSSYNDVNASSASQNSMVLNGLLKDELGFQGFITTDWLSQQSGVGSALAGLDMSMPGDTFANSIPLVGYSHWMNHLAEAVLNGSLPVDRLNDMSTRIVAAWYQRGQDKNFPKTNFHSYVSTREGSLYPGAVISPQGVVNEFIDVQADHAKVAKQVAQDAITLLKNDKETLPLSKSSNLFVFGTAAQEDSQGINSCGDKACNRGTLTMGWGSGSATLPYLDDPISSLKRKASKVTFYNTDSFPSVPTPSNDDIAIVFITSDSGENSYTVDNNHGDRDASGLAAWHGGDNLVKNAAAKYSNVVVVVQTVGPITMESWIGLESVKAVLFAHLPGQEAGDSLTEVLFGEVSPSGHLPYSIPVKENDYPDSLNLVGSWPAQAQDTYSEGIYVDYRYLNKQKTKPRFAFGHGKSYTTFKFSDASIKKVTGLSRIPPARPAKAKSPIPGMNNKIPAASEAYEPDKFSYISRYLYSWMTKSDADKAYKIGAAGTANYPYPNGYSNTQRAGPTAGGPNGGNPALWDTAWTISVKVTNSGTKYSGKAVGQVYVQFPSGISYDTPVIQLRDFEKTATLQPGASATLQFKLTRKDVSVWDVKEQNWVVPDVKGSYKIWIGESSDDLHVVCDSSSNTCKGDQDSPV